MNESIKDALEVLQGLRLRPITQAVDMLKVPFGEIRETPDRKGLLRKVPEWQLHIQTPWRFKRAGRILLGVRDLYFTVDTGEDYEWRKDSCESRFQRIAASFNEEMDADPSHVTSIRSDDVGGFALSFSNGLEFEVFPNQAFSSGDYEFWRLFRPLKETPHFVVATDEPGRDNFFWQCKNT